MIEPFFDGYARAHDVRAELQLLPKEFLSLVLRYVRTHPGEMDDSKVLGTKSYTVESASKFLEWCDDPKNWRSRGGIVGTEYEFAIPELAGRGLTLREICNATGLKAQHVWGFAKRRGIRITKLKGLNTKHARVRTCRDCQKQVPAHGGGVIRLYCADCGKKRWLKMKADLRTLTFKPHPKK